MDRILRAALAVAISGMAGVSALAVPGSAQSSSSHATKTPPRDAQPDTPGLTCQEILQMSSTDWVAKFTAARGANSQETVQAIGVYGKCYDARTDQLAASLAKNSKGPLIGARANFRDFESSLKDFTAKALLSSQPPADAVKTAYADLYEKQFRHEFYEAYQQKGLPVAPIPANAPNARKTQIPPAETPAQAPVPTTTATNDADPITQAKNHFGELLGDLPDESMHSLHSAFAEILGPNSATPETQLLVYRYAIFLLEPPGGQPFSPPPF